MHGYMSDPLRRTHRPHRKSCRPIPQRVAAERQLEADEHLVKKHKYHRENMIKGFHAFNSAALKSVTRQYSWEQYIYHREQYLIAECALSGEKYHRLSDTLIPEKRGA